MINWIKLTEAESNHAWKLFNNRFNFQPSILPKDWPSIHVSNDRFLTYSFTRSIHGLDNLDDYCVNCFKSLIFKDE